MRPKLTEEERKIRGKMARERYRLKCAEKARIAKRQYQETHYEEYLANYRASQSRVGVKQRAGLVGKDSTLTGAEWLMIVRHNKYRCFYCHERFDLGRLTIDHVIPLSKGGLHVKENIVPACHSCNAAKKDKLIFLPQTRRKRRKPWQANGLGIVQY